MLVVAHGVGLQRLVVNMDSRKFRQNERTRIGGIALAALMVVAAGGLGCERCPVTFTCGLSVAFSTTLALPFHVLVVADDTTGEWDCGTGWVLTGGEGRLLQCNPGGVIYGGTPARIFVLITRAEDPSFMVGGCFEPEYRVYCPPEISDGCTAGNVSLDVSAAPPTSCP